MMSNLNRRIALPMKRGVAPVLGLLIFLLMGCANEPLLTYNVASTRNAEEHEAAVTLANKQLEALERLLANGVYADSILAYSDLLDDERITADQRRQAHYHLAEAFFKEGEAIAAALTWEEFIERYPNNGHLPQATLMAARAYHAADQCNRAVAHYERFQQYEDRLNDLVFEWIGDCLAANRELENAVDAFREALNWTDDRTIEAGLREKIADNYLSLGDYEAAVNEYDAILDFAEIDDYRAKIEYLAGQALAATGQTDAASARYYRAIETYPEAEHAYFALVELVYGGAGVDSFQRGLVDYYAGAKYPDAYGASIRAFDSYLSSEPADRIDEALYYKALSQRALGQIPESMATLDQLITEHSQSDYFVKSWYEKGVAQARAGDTDAAIETYTGLADQFPDSDLAPEALWQAGRTRQGEGAHSEAARIFEALAGDFSDYEDVDAVLWYAGLARYRADEVDKAVHNWRDLIETQPESIYAPKALYWLGKVDSWPEDTDTLGYWEQLRALHPKTYYSLRVNDLEAEESLTSTRLNTTPVESPSWDRDRYQAEILPWLQEWTELPASTESLSLPLTVTESLDFSKGQVLLQVGMRNEALNAFERVRSSLENDPVVLATLGAFFREQSLYGLAASSAARLVDLWPDGDIHDAPLTLQYLIYPLAYEDLLTIEAENYGMDPLLLAALVRQESLFEPTAESWVGARGLGQVMPATGEYIAQDLGIVDFEVDDLFRPSISIQFGAHYLASQLERFDDQILVALAAYNAGPGNALQWLEASDDNLDLFVEVITAVQSRLYLQGIYEQYVIYEQLYRPDPEAADAP